MFKMWAVITKSRIIGGGLFNVDKKPRTRVEKDAVLWEVFKQCREVVGVGAKITRPCGRRVQLTFSYKCFHCDIWFCKACATRHFG